MVARPRKSIGKLAPGQLDRLLRRFTAAPDASVLIGPAVGLDAAAVRVGDRVLVAASDPITFATDRIGAYAVDVNANDVAVLGARPRWMLATLLLPPGGARRAAPIFGQLHAACRRLGVSLIGGHTEMTHTVRVPVVSGTMLGLVKRSYLARRRRVRAGDVVVQVRPLAIEGAALIAREKAAALRGRLPARLLARARRLLDVPGISIVDAARVAVEAGAKTMHDPTEGGLLMGAWELAAAVGVGVDLDADAALVLPEAEALCGHFGLDVLGTLASGCLLAVCAPRTAARLLAAAGRRGMAAAAIGRLVEGPSAFRRRGRRRRLRPNAVDEVTKLF
jgi:hydrogenase maturation factor